MLGVRLDQETERGLDALARRTRRPKSQIAREAIRAYVAQHGRIARAKAEWSEISRAERESRETGEILGFAAGGTDCRP
jgi:RHH-type rel operon transcriptional repressor/antitoxin RelB